MIKLSKEGVLKAETGWKLGLVHQTAKAWMQGDSSWRKLKELLQGFPGGAVVKNPPANAGDTGLSPGPGRSHILWSNWARAPQLLSLCVL